MTYAIGALVRVTDASSSLCGFRGEIVGAAIWPGLWKVKFSHYELPLLMAERALEVIA